MWLNFPNTLPKQLINLYDCASVSVVKMMSLEIYEIYFLPKFNNNIIGIIFITTYKLHRGVQTRQVKIYGMDLNHIVAIKESVLHALISTVHTIKYKGKPINDVN
jgi:hypothetical protein